MVSFKIFNIIFFYRIEWIFDTRTKRSKTKNFIVAIDFSLYFLFLFFWRIKKRDYDFKINAMTLNNYFCRLELVDGLVAINELLSVVLGEPDDWSNIGGKTFWWNWFTIFPEKIIWMYSICLFFFKYRFR